MLPFLLQAAEVDDAELMELMDHCEASGDSQQDSAAPTHIQQTEPEQTGSPHKNLPRSESSQEWDKPATQETERESEGSFTRHGGEEKSQQEPRDDGEKEGGSENGSEMHEESEGSGWGQRVCHTHERAVPMQDTVDELDITEEGERKY